MSGARTRVYRVLLVLCLIPWLLSVSCGGDLTKESPTYRIAIAKIIDHPAINAMDSAFRAQLEADTVLQGHVSFVEFNAQGSMEKADEDALKIAGGDFDLAFVLGTPSALALRDHTTSLPIVLGGATDPVSAGLVEDWNRPGGNITGTTDLPPWSVHLQVLKAVLPEARKIATIFTNTEQNSRAAVEFLREAVEAQGLELVEIGVASAEELEGAVVRAAADADVLAIPTDNTVQANLESVMRVSQERELPAFNCDRASVERGCLFSVAVEYSDLGRVSARIAREILLEDRDPSEIPVARIENPRIYLNGPMLEAAGIEVPERILGEAEIVK